MARVAARLGQGAAHANPGLPSLWLFTDPERLPDPLATAAALPRGAGVVLRTFGRAHVERLAPALAALARRRGLILLIGEDAALAARVGAHGVHLPQRRWRDLARLRTRHPSWRLTLAAHDVAALRHARSAGADAVFLSPVFASASPSANTALGVVGFAQLVRSLRAPVFALGGLTAPTAGRLVGTGAAGLAAIDGLRT